MCNISVLLVAVLHPIQFLEGVIPGGGGSNYQKKKVLFTVTYVYIVFFPSWRKKKETITLKYQLNWTEDTVITHVIFYHPSPNPPAQTPSCKYCPQYLHQNRGIHQSNSWLFCFRRQDLRTREKEQFLLLCPGQ